MKIQLLCCLLLVQIFQLTWCSNEKILENNDHQMDQLQGFTAEMKSNEHVNKMKVESVDEHELDTKEDANESKDGGVRTMHVVIQRRPRKNSATSIHTMHNHSVLMYFYFLPFWLVSLFIHKLF
ncbi:hypothetical protein IHE45_16G059300 [Dioscorea alata]|uniref:Uncharacterized protein n=1 Tax=Dioscorea alata TaxID=55571 RepID=A0ACB7UHT6_DIOAL|nr:hypothetical protein IHE45_16G059300 [Dioscorea alata]